MVCLKNNMTPQEAEKIFRAWQEYIEINDKMDKVFSSIPESFLPYPVKVLEEALNIEAKKYFDAGDKKMSRNIQEVMCTLIRYKDDEEALKSIHQKLDLILNNPEIKEVILAGLKNTCDFWADFKAKKLK
jgi:hypothetical protein